MPIALNPVDAASASRDAIPERQRNVDVQREIERILAVPGLRSADRANLRRMLVEVQKGRSLSVEQRENLWAYRTRYLGEGRI